LQEGFKVCSKCLLVKNLEAFTHAKRYTGGYRHECKECVSKEKVHYIKEGRKESGRYINPTILERTCTKCLLIKPSSQFYRDTRRKNGLDSKCKKCRSVYATHYRVTHKEQLSSHYSNRRALEKGAIGSYTTQEWLKLKSQYNFTCLSCGRKEPEIKLTRDHILPLKWGGSNLISNLQPLCMSCNLSKGAKDVDYRLNKNGQVSGEQLRLFT
jgi:5-methylcytosine-specific restriction endonuclease McrA